MGSNRLSQYHEICAPSVQPYGQSPYPPAAVELPAPLPPVPPTTTSETQLREDELLAQKLQQCEVEAARRETHTNGPQVPHLMNAHYSDSHKYSSQSVRPPLSIAPSTSTSNALSAAPWSPGSFGVPPQPWQETRSAAPVLPSQPPAYRSYSDLPILAPQLDAYPIPVLSEEISALPGAKTPIALDDTALSAYLEQHRQVPYPPQWHLAPALETLFAFPESKSTSTTSWLDHFDAFTWRTTRPEKHAQNPSPPSYAFKYQHGHMLFRKSKYLWTMKQLEGNETTWKKHSKHQTATWAYELSFEPSTGVRKHEILLGPKEKPVKPIYVHGKNYDVLRFLDPNDRACMWVSSTRVSSIDGRRYDTIRHALFMASGGHLDPLYGELVADHTFWDGYVDENEAHIGIRCHGCQAQPITGMRWKCKTCLHHDVCNACRVLSLNGHYAASIKSTCDFSLVNLPDEALYIRSTSIQPALIVATLQILKDWEKRSLQNEKLQNPVEFLVGEEATRECDLGVISHWRASDWEQTPGDMEKVGTKIKAKGIRHSSASHGAAVHGIVAASSTAAALGGTIVVNGRDGGVS